MASPARCCLWLLGIPWTMILVLFGFCRCQTNQSQEQGQLLGFNSIVSTVRYPNLWLRPYDWTYIRVDIPSWFSSVTVTVLTDIDVGLKVENLPKAILPIFCFREGGLPIPDVSDDSLNHLASSFSFNGSIGILPNQGPVEQCFPFKKNFTLPLTNEQITSGVWYIGYFYGLGPERTQSKMIRRGRSHKFSTRIDIAGCSNPVMWGQYCNQSIITPSCAHTEENMHQRSVLDTSAKRFSAGPHDRLETRHFSPDYSFPSKLETSHIISRSQFDMGTGYSRRSLVQSVDNTIRCMSSFNTSCLGNGQIIIYALDIVGPTSFFKITTSEIIFNKTSVLNNTNTNGVRLVCSVRKDSFPSRTAHDSFSDITTSPMIIPSPAIGRWYIMISAIIEMKGSELLQQRDHGNNVCFSFEWQVHECPLGKIGLNCTWESYNLERISTSQDLVWHYFPAMENSIDSTDFPLEILLSNSSFGSISDVAWTYFLLDVPSGAGGSNIHFKLTSDGKMNYEVYSKFGSVPTSNSWDYYANNTSASNNSMLLTMDNDGESTIEFYILYPKEGSWSFGIKHSINREHDIRSYLSISLQACPGRCSSHGDCESAADESGMTEYGFCSCDRNHGGFDCSVVLISPKEHIWHSIFLVASNGAAILPAIWALRRRAFAEWVTFSCSGISSGLYHVCDVGTLCLLSFRVLQFLDFWLSFMAVVSTFVYMTSINESSKRAILTGFSVFTALLAANGPTRSQNIVLVIAIGAVGLIFGWLIEILSSRRNRTFLSGCNFSVQLHLQNARTWPKFVITFIHKKFQWQCVLLGCIALSAAGISWKLESSESYWVWHSIWHLTIYTSSFFFLCSKRISNRNQEAQAPEYELRQQSPSRLNESNEAQC